MRKTTVYIPDELKAGLARASQASGRSEAELIREAIGLAIDRAQDPEPVLPLIESDDPTLAERVEEALEGFGDR